MYIQKITISIIGLALLALTLTSCAPIIRAPTADRDPLMNSDSHRTYRYVVKTGDTLFAISKLHGLTVDQIVKMNRIKSPDLIQVDQVLIVDPRLVANVSSSTPNQATTNNHANGNRVAISRTQPTRKKTSTQTASTKPKSPAPAAKPQPKPKPTTVATHAQNPAPSSSHQLTPTQPVATAQPNKEEVSMSKPSTLIPPTDGWMWPTSGKPTNKFENDDGLEYFLNVGNEIVAAVSGKITYAGVALSDYKHMILIKTSDGYVVQYDFNTELTAKENDTVNKGDTLIQIRRGEDNAGDDEDQYRSVFFGIWKKGVPQNPNNLISGG